VRKLTEEDAHLLVEWLSNPLVLQYYEGRDRPLDIAMVRASFYLDDDETRCIIEYDSAAIGYIQFYALDAAEKSKYGYTDVEETIYGTDQFIGNTSYWNLGIGKLLVGSMVDFLVHFLEGSSQHLNQNIRYDINYQIKAGFPYSKDSSFYGSD
jgi:aminoglycoside 6'-N-acetyltransferase